MSGSSGWQLAGDAPNTYSWITVKVMEPWTDDLIRSARCRDGDRVLDVACGTGLVARRVNLVTGKLCAVTGIDLNEGMLGVARQTPGIAWHQGSATELPFPDASFDVVLCQQGLQYIPDRAAAMREIARVLVPGGRLALNVWGGLDRQPFQSALLDAIRTFLPQECWTAFDMAFSLDTVEALRTLAAEAGLEQEHVRFEHRTLRHPSPAFLVEGFMGATPVTAQFLALAEDERRAFVAHAVEKLAGYIDDAGLAVPQENHFLTASKPARAA